MKFFLSKLIFWWVPSFSSWHYSFSPMKIITFIMKVQNLEDVREQLFSESLKMSPKLRTKKQHFMLRIPLFDLIYQKKGDQNFQTIMNHIRMVKVDFAEVIFQNEDDRTFNYILKGGVALYTRTKNQQRRQQQKLYKRLEAGEYFGEKMSYGKEELERAVSTSQGYLLQLPMNVFYNTFAGHFKYDQLRDKINFLKSIWIFSQVKRTLLERILLSSESKRYTRNSILCRQGDSPSFLLVILEGELTLKMSKEGKSKAFCVLGKSQVCGIQEMMEDKCYEYTAICSSDYSEILKVDRETIMGIVERDIKPEILKKRKQLALQLKRKNLDSTKLVMYSQKQLELTRRSQEKRSLTQRKRYKSEGGKPNPDPIEPLNRVKVLNELFDREVQLKESQLRRYKLQHIEEAQRNLTNTNRISTYTNSCYTYDKEIIVKYLGRKERKYQDILRKEREFMEKRIVVVPELKVEKSSAVKNQKRKLKYSRKHFYSTLEIYQ